jgi:hypothetical protein
MDQGLIYAVTALGVVLSVFSFVVIFRGQPIPSDTGSAQELEFKGLKLKTNVVVMLLAVSVIVAVLPLSLQAWLLGKEQDLRAKQPASPAGNLAVGHNAPDLEIFITGQVLDAAGSQVERATVTVTNLKNFKPGDLPSPVQTVVTDGSGGFDFPPLPLGPGDKYKVVASKEGFVEQTVYMGPGGAVGFKTILVAKKKAGARP